MKYELIDCATVRPDDLVELISEFQANGEFCNALWRANEIGAIAWLKELNNDDGTERHEYVLGFFVGDTLAGVARVTPHPNHEANGTVGYYLRPSFRGERYGPVLLHMIEDYCIENRIKNVVAVTDVTNKASVRTLTLANWIPTGRTFVWVSEDNARNALEFRPSRLRTIPGRIGR